MKEQEKQEALRTIRHFLASDFAPFSFVPVSLFLSILALLRCT
jgi:hypothetical protein